MLGNPRSVATPLAALVLAFVLAGCGGTVRATRTADAPRSEVAEATGRTQVMVVEGPGRPLIVDWSSEQRLDLEVAMREGVAVVRYTGDTLSLLSACTIEGSYGFVGVTQKSEVVRLESAAEVQANLPLGGMGLSSTIGGNLVAGSTLDVAMVIVGKSRTTWATPTTGDLSGVCAGATHFVRGAIVGAFALSVGEKSQARTAVEVFDQGVNASGGTLSGLQRRDGDMAACAQADPDAERPPKQCGALIRLELLPIVAVASEAATAAAPPQEVPVANCGRGYVEVDGKCTPAGASTARRACSPEDAAACAARCEANDADSCAVLARVASGGGASNADDALKFATKACRLRSGVGCLLRGRLLQRRGDGEASLKAFVQGCDQGQGEACRRAAVVVLAADARDPAKAARLNRRGCDAGDDVACIGLAVQHAAGDGVPLSHETSLRLNARACDGGVATACGNVGLHYEFGMTVDKDRGHARTLYERACRLDKAACLRLGMLLDGAPGADPKMVRRAFKRACEAKGRSFGALACAYGGDVYGWKRPYDPKLLDDLANRMVRQCDKGVVARACTFIGAAWLYRGDELGLKALDLGCEKGDAWACRLAKRAAARPPKAN